MVSRRFDECCAAVFCLGALVLTAGCRVDGAWSDPKPPKDAVVDETMTDDVDVVATVDDTNLADMQEVDLVEQVVAHRRAYRRALEELRLHYRMRGNASKLGWADFELDGLRRVKPFRYLLDAEVPPTSLRATDPVPEADALFKRGQELMRMGGHGVPGVYREDRMIQASTVLRELVERYPTSDKIDDAAFLLGEIHREYMPGQDILAALWYERAHAWNPRTLQPALFRAAVIYDQRLHDRDRALELYQAVVHDDGQSGRHARYAANRIHELSRDWRTADAR